jgi:hypothetical protein
MDYSSELNFSLVGSKIPYLTRDDSADSVYVDRQYNGTVGYLEVPLSIQYKVHRFYVGVGPGVAFRLFNKKLNSVYINNYKTLDVSGNLLAGYKIAKRLDVNVRYSYGLLNILNYNDQSYDTRMSLKNRFLNLSVLYSLK